MNVLDEFVLARHAEFGLFSELVQEVGKRLEPLTFRSYSVQQGRSYDAKRQNSLEAP